MYACKYVDFTQRERLSAIVLKIYKENLQEYS